MSVTPPPIEGPGPTRPQTPKKLHASLIQYGDALLPEIREREVKITEQELKVLVGASRMSHERPIESRIELAKIRMEKEIFLADLKGMQTAFKQAISRFNKLKRRFIKPKLSEAKENELNELQDSHSDVVRQITNIDQVGEISQKIFILQAKEAEAFAKGDFKSAEKIQKDFDSTNVDFMDNFEELLEKGHDLELQIYGLLQEGGENSYQQMLDLLKDRLNCETEYFQKSVNTLWEQRIRMFEKRLKAETEGNHTLVEKLNQEIADFDKSFDDKVKAYEDVVLEKNRSLIDGLENASHSYYIDRSDLLDDKRNKKLDAIKELESDVKHIDKYMDYQWGLQKNSDLRLPAIFAYQRDLQNDEPMVELKIDPLFVGQGSNKLLELIETESKNKFRRSEDRLALQHLHARLKPLFNQTKEALEKTKEKPDKRKEVLKTPISLFITESDELLFEGIRGNLDETIGA